MTSTCYEYNSISMLHMLNEKNNGILKLYKKFISKGKILNNRTVWKICRLSLFDIIDRIKQLIKRNVLTYSIKV